MGVVFDYDSLFSLESQPHVPSGLSYSSTVSQFITALNRIGVGSEVLSREDRFSDYRVLIAPLLHLCDAETAQRLEEYVRDGGVLILTARSGVKDMSNAIVDQYLPGLLRELAGCYVEEYDAFSSNSDLEVFCLDSSGDSYRGEGLAEVLVPLSAESVLTYGNRYYKGKTAATENRVGNGRCLYLGLPLVQSDLTRFLWTYLADTLDTIPDLPDHLEISKRIKGDNSYRFYMNHSQNTIVTDTVADGLDLLSGERISRSVQLPPFGVLIVKESVGADE